MLGLTLKSNSALISLVFLQLFCGTYAMSCTYNVGIVEASVECPTIFQDKDKVFCCQNDNTIPYCCDLGEFISTNSAIIGGIIAGAIVLLLILITCCCCCCSCCWCAQRRMQRGTILYVPVGNTPVHLPQSQYPGSQPVYPMANPVVASASPMPPAYADHDADGKQFAKY